MSVDSTTINDGGMKALWNQFLMILSFSLSHTSSFSLTIFFPLNIWRQFLQKWTELIESIFRIDGAISCWYVSFTGILWYRLYDTLTIGSVPED